MKNPLPLNSPLVTVTFFMVGTGCRQAAVDTSGSDGANSRQVSVSVLAAAPTTTPRSTTQPATVHAYYEARVFGKAAGYLIELNADIGAIVKAGDVLAVIDVPELASEREAKLATIRRLEAEQQRANSQLAVAQASKASYRAKRDTARAEVGKADAGLTAARFEFERVGDLVQQKALADRLLDEARQKHDFAAAEKTAAESAVVAADAELTLADAQGDSAKADLDVAQATTDVARRELDRLDELIKYARLTAPFDGIVTQRNVDPGDLVRNTQTGSSDDGSPLFIVTQLDKVRVRVAVPERDVPLTTVGDAAEITLQALPGQMFHGTVSRVAGVLDERTRTMLVEIDLPNPDGRLRPGMFGQATIILEAPGDTLTLPANAVRYDEQGSSYVYVVNDSSAIETAAVTTGLDDGQNIEITAGLAGHERIVGPMLRRLRSGQTVKVD